MSLLLESKRTMSNESPQAALAGMREDGGFPAVYTARGIKRRKIKRHDLGRYVRPVIAGNRSGAWRAGWYIVNALFFQSAILALIPSRWKAMLLRAFGAKVGRGFACKPRVTIKYPWFLEFGDNVWLGEMVWIDNHTWVRIGNDVCISQGAYLFTGNHDWNDPRFAFFCAPIEIGDGCWVGALTPVVPGSRLASGAVLAVQR